MKKIIIFIITAILTLLSTAASAASIPRETLLLNATEEQTQIVETLISDILEDVKSDKLGYALAAGYANTRIRKAVIAKQTNGNGYGILSPIAQNAIRHYSRKRRVSPAANGVPAESSFNSLSLIDRTAKRNHNLIAALISSMQNEQCSFNRLCAKTYH